MLNPETKVWLNGEIIAADEARLSHLTHTFHYGLGAFEGIRSYEVRPGVGGVFRLQEHIDRLFASCHLVTITAEDIGATREQIMAACVDTLRVNGLTDGYIRPVIYLGEGAMGIGALTNPTHTMVAAWKWGAYLGEEGLTKGIDACISSYNRPGHSGTLSKGKLAGQYINSILAKREALSNGFHEAILLNEEGLVTEASGENLFIVKDGQVITPPLGLNILAGITRATVMQLATELGIAVVERTFARDELYLADEVFMTGTAAEVTPVRSVDRRRIGQGSRGPITEKLQSLYFDVVQGRSAPHSDWLTPFDV
ncbi:MAG: branched-chain amino acid transaminase [Myxococcales bacterium]|nr:branched-chain amino acid transaminase [Myxococcales bacterium]